MCASSLVSKARTKDLLCRFLRVEEAGAQRTQDRRRHMDKMELAWSKIYRVVWTLCMDRWQRSIGSKKARRVFRAGRGYYENAMNEWNTYEETSDWK